MILLLGTMVVLAFATNDQAYQLLSTARSELLTTQNLVYVSLFYTLCLATPFMPGIELGLLIMFLFGLPGVVAAYSSTVVGLTIAFLIGRLGFTRQPQIHDDGKISRILAGLKTHPYLVIAVVLNMPGNWVIGGGGGISVLAGMSTYISLIKFVGTVCVAIAPLPLLVAFGLVNLEGLV